MNLFKRICKNNVGLSLVELIATVAIMGLVSAGIGVAVVSASRNYSKGSSEVDLQQEVQNITNILNNLIVDSASVVNGTNLSGDPDPGSISITAVNGDVYKIEFDSSSGKLLYTKLVAGMPDGPYTLSENVKVFTADCSQYDTDHSVHFDLEFTSSTNDRDMNTAFTSMSRNAETGMTLNIESTGALVIDPQAVIEPNQTIEIPFDMLWSGETPTMTYSVSDISTASGSYVTVDTTLTNTNKKIVVHAGPNEGIKYNFDGSFNSFYDTIYINLSITGTKEGATVYTITQPVLVHIRRITGFGFSGGLNSGAFGKKNSDYKILSSISGYNTDRFFALATDDDYISPDKVWVKATASASYGNGNVGIQIKNSDDTDVGSAFTIASMPLNDPVFGDYFVLEPGQYFIARLNGPNDLQSGQKIEFTAYAVHASYNAAAAVGDPNTAVNKTTAKYAMFEGKYSIAPSIFPNPPSGFKRGADNEEPSFYDKFPSATDQIKVFVEDFYLQYLKDNYPTDNAVLSDGTTKAVADLTEDMVVGMLKDKISFSPFYSVGSTTEPNDPALSTNHYEYEDGWYWSQYRIMGGTGGGNAYHLQKPNDGDGSIEIVTTGDNNPGALRLDPDQEYLLEFISILYNNTGSDITIIPGKEVINNKDIIWPYYPKLLKLGFGEKTGRGEIYSGAGFSLVEEYKEASEGGGYYSYANMYPVSPADMQYKTNSTYGISEGDKTVGSETNPISLGSSEQGIFFNQIEWDGLATNAYINRANGIVQVNKKDGNGWVTLVTDIKNSTDVTGSGLKVQAVGSEGKYKFMSQGEPVNNNYVYRLIPTIKQYRYYIKDSEGVFSRTIHGDNGGASGFVFNYPGDTGTIYFKKYGNSVSVTLNANGGTVNGSGTYVVSSFVAGKDTLPNAVSSTPGKYFAGWYTESSGGTLVSKPTINCTLYAHYDTPSCVKGTVSSRDLYGTPCYKFTVTTGCLPVKSFKIYTGGGIGNRFDLSSCNGNPSGDCYVLTAYSGNLIEANTTKTFEFTLSGGVLGDIVDVEYDTP